MTDGYRNPTVPYKQPGAAPTGNTVNGHPRAGTPGWKSYTEGVWAKNHPYAGQQGLDPKTGQPVMPSQKQLIAKAHSQAWKSISDMMAQLPSVDATTAPYNAQRAAIAPLVEAHRDWLLKAGDYQTQMVNGLAQLVQQNSQQADDRQQGFNGLAGGPATNVSPAQTAAPVLGYGKENAAYLQALLPFATAQGIGQEGKVNAAQADALAARNEAVRKIAAQGGDLQTKIYGQLSTDAFNQLKANYAALAAGAKTGSTAAALKERTRHDQAAEATAARNAGTAELRAQNAVQLAEDKRGQKLSDSARAALQKGLVQADKAYTATTPGAPGKAGGQGFEVSVVYNGPKGLGGLGSAPKGVEHTFYGGTRQEASQKAQAWINKDKSGRTATADPNNPFSYSLKPAKVYKNGTTAAGKTLAPEPERRIAAWRQLVAINNTLGAQAWTEDQLRALFRSEFGAPK